MNKSGRSDGRGVKFGLIFNQSSMIHIKIHNDCFNICVVQICMNFDADWTASTEHRTATYSVHRSPISKKLWKIRIKYILYSFIDLLILLFMVGRIVRLEQTRFYRCCLVHATLNNLDTLSEAQFRKRWKFIASYQYFCC